MEYISSSSDSDEDFEMVLQLALKHKVKVHQYLNELKKPRSIHVNPYLMERQIKGRFASDVIINAYNIYIS